ncbi:hypothetical protein BDP81DRAFT_52349 [Colletotrichum phormii]|uniref:Uncharacterized protein n=1 Tax=Colletotrichum phormii TaxID=359342 RepID=A0AAI9ZML3_9PEZI|nr:uncharacterized protein BDP81DRAFT_52349 [Colletotrichum phormii]KAK1634738.1 hypothetical protein BDP81DRAFT_52349 [Colletotrichum phormii]
MNPPVTRQDLRCPRRSMRTSTVRSPQCNSLQRAPAGTCHVHHQTLPKSLDSVVPRLLFLESASSSNTCTSYSSIHFGAMALLWHSRSHTDLTFCQYQPRHVVNERFNSPAATAPNLWGSLTRSVRSTYRPPLLASDVKLAYHLPKLVSSSAILSTHRPLCTYMSATSKFSLALQHQPPCVMPSAYTPLLRIVGPYHGKAVPAPLRSSKISPTLKPCLLVSSGAGLSVPWEQMLHLFCWPRCPICPIAWRRSRTRRKILTETSLGKLGIQRLTYTGL